MLIVLSNLESVSLELQKENTTLLDVRVNFDEVLREMPQLIGRFSKSADFISCKTFEDSIVLLQQGQGEDLSAGQKEAASMLKISSFRAEETTQRLSLAE